MTTPPPGLYRSNRTQVILYNTRTGCIEAKKIHGGEILMLQSITPKGRGNNAGLECSCIFPDGFIAKTTFYNRSFKLSLSWVKHQHE